MHVLEGNNPNAVARNTYPITYTRILGYGTVHQLAGTGMRQGNSGKWVLQLQNKLVRLGLLNQSEADGTYGNRTAEAITQWQQRNGLKANGIADQATQHAIDWQL